ncbi:MAG: D-alanyl-D-alanine carboxypeptidase [Clostridiales bacterium]|jgi:D-alanyl-D-alanine carboxypeptidase (penicillin-binding protein 5/6)|nr:D-alanyl-D-alanine carboxypeptidase [Clostridiales bacterium]
MRNKRFLAMLLTILLLLSVIPVNAQEFSFQSKATLLMDAGSRQILYESNAHEQLYPASVTKIMTMLLAMEALDEGKVTLGDMIPVSERASGHGGSQIFLSPGDRISFEDLMIGIGVGSANDGAIAMAEFLGGSVEAFVDQMNEKAAVLGMVNTNFVNPHGLHDENHYTTAYDIALMSLELMRYPKIHEWLTIWMDEEFLKDKIKKSEGVYLSNANRLVRYYDGADGVKTGFTNEAGNCVSATAIRGDTRLLAVVLGAPGRPALFDEARELLDWGFANFRSVPVVKKGDVLGTIRVDKGMQETVDLVAAQDLSLLLKKGTKDDIEQEVIMPGRAAAPLSVENELGELVVTSADGEELGRVALIPAVDVPRANLITFFRRFTEAWLKFGR